MTGTVPLEDRPEDSLFKPVASEPLRAPVSLFAAARLMRDNPLAILPEPLFRETRLSGPYLGRAVHEVSGPAEMKSILQDNFEAWRKSPLILRMLRPVLGDAILTAHGKSWRRQRTMLQPSFLKRRIDRFAATMIAAGRQSAETLGGAGAGPIEIMGVMYDATFGVIEQVLFSDLDGFDRGDVRQAIDVLLEDIGRVRYSDLAPWPDWAPRLLTPSARRARRVFRGAVEGQIARRRQQAQAGDDLLGLLLDARDPETGDGLDDVEIRDTVMTFIAAGHETTAISLTWALYLLSHDVEVQTAVRAEARSVLASGVPDAEKARRLTLTRMVIEEAMRLFPPAPVLGRQAIRDTEICGHPVRKGDVALLAFYALHRHETLWAHPDRFDPLRWSEARRPVDRYQFMAFGGGPRACIGAQFAMMEASLMLGTLVDALSFAPAAGKVAPVMQVTLRPRDGLCLHIRPAP